MNSPIDIATRLLHMPAVAPLQPPTSPAIYPSVGFRFRDYAHAKGVFDGSIPGLVGARAGNPTAVGFETRIAALEGAQAALAEPSGMAAVTAGLLAFARAGDSIVVDHVVYVGTFWLLREVLSGFGIEVRAVDTTDLGQVERAIDATTRAIFVESPGSWQLKIPNIEALAKLAKPRGVRLIVDGTMATGYLQQPLALGADLVVYSATGYLNGHAGILLFELADVDAVARFVAGLEIIAFTVGIGGPITTVFCPAHSFPGASPDELAQRGVSERLVRLSIGLEAADDVVRDVDRALQNARASA